MRLLRAIARKMAAMRQARSISTRRRSHRTPIFKRNPERSFLKTLDPDPFAVADHFNPAAGKISGCDPRVGARYRHAIRGHQLIAGMQFFRLRLLRIDKLDYDSHRIERSAIAPTVHNAQQFTRIELSLADRVTED